MASGSPPPRDKAVISAKSRTQAHVFACLSEYALDVAKPDDPAGAWRHDFRAAPQFETADSRYAWLNNIIAVTKSRTGDGGPIHRVFAVK
jgi:hypothetical protein